MALVKVTGWISSDEFDKYTDADEMGIEFWYKAYGVVRDYCRVNGLKIGAFTHQRTRIPILDNTYAFMVTFRTWGGLMAEIWGDPNDKMGYCEFSSSDEEEGFEKLEKTKEKNYSEKTEE